MSQEQPFAFGGLSTIGRIHRQIKASGGNCHVSLFSDQDIDNLGPEVSEAFERCSVDQNTISDAERELTKLMIYTIRCMVDPAMQTQTPGPRMLLFRNTIMTSTNLEALLRTTDADNRTGSVRCLSVSVLGFLIDMTSVFDIEMTDGSNFASKWLTSYLKAMNDDLNPTNAGLHDPNCRCNHSISDALLTMLVATKEKPDKLLDRVHAVDWNAIFRAAECCRVPNCYGCHSSDMFMFLHKHVCLPVLRVDPSHDKSRSLLRKLGSSWELFRFVLRGVASGDLLQWHPRPVNQNTINSIIVTSEFLLRFLVGRLVPLLSDPKTDDLVFRAHSALVARSSSLPAAPNSTGVYIEQVLELLNEESWTELKENCDQIRSDCFSRVFLSDEAVPKARKLMREYARAGAQQTLEETVGKNEMCANCFVLETALVENHRKLMKCSACRVTYCGRDCQAEHWTKAHKKQCKCTSTGS
jgi:hypothetical protein